MKSILPVYDALGSFPWTGGGTIPPFVQTTYATIPPTTIAIWR